MRDVAVARLVVFVVHLPLLQAAVVADLEGRELRHRGANSREEFFIRSDCGLAVVWCEILQMIGAFEKTPEDGAHDGDIHRGAHAEVVGFAVRKLVRVLR